MSQGNNADTNGDQKPDPKGTHGCFEENSPNCNSKEKYALDFAMPVDSTVVAAAEGIVKFVRDDSKEGGCSSVFANSANYVVIDHTDRTSTLYLHLQYKSALVKRGDKVRQGQPIAKSGQTGWACGAHLHFQRQEQGDSWYTSSLPISFTDVSENQGVPIADPNYRYTSKNSEILDGTEPPRTASPTPDFNNDGKVDFDDFFLFASAFLKKATGEYAKFDLDGDGDIGFSDFFILAGAFGK